MKNLDLQEASKLMVEYLETIKKPKKSLMSLKKLCRLQASSDDLVICSGAEIDNESGQKKCHQEMTGWIAHIQNLLDEYFVSRGGHYRLCVGFKDSGNGGSRATSKFFLDIKPLNEKEVANIKLNIDKPSVPENGIEYQINREESELNSWLDRAFKIIGFRKWIMIIIATSPILLTTLIYFRIGAELSSVDALYAGLIIGGLINLIMPLYRLISSGIHMIELFGRRNSVLILRTAKHNGVFTDHREVIKRVYSAECKICGGEIVLERRMFGMTVNGICKENPQLHRYTFDWVTNTGERMNHLN